MELVVPKISGTVTVGKRKQPTGHITDLNDESYSVVKPIPIIVLELQDEGYWLVECAGAGSLCWSGDTQEEAIEGLREWLSSRFDLFERLGLDGARLGPDMVSQRNLLRSHIQRSTLLT